MDLILVVDLQHLVLYSNGGFTRQILGYVFVITEFPLSTFGAAQSTAGLGSWP